MFFRFETNLEINDFRLTVEINERILQNQICRHKHATIYLHAEFSEDFHVIHPKNSLDEQYSIIIISMNVIEIVL